MGWVRHAVRREDRQQHEAEHVVAHLGAEAAMRHESVNRIASESSEMPSWTRHFQRLRSLLARLGWDVRDGRNVKIIMNQLLDGHMVGPNRAPGSRSVSWLPWHRALALRRESVRVDGGEIDRGIELEVDWRILADVTARQALRLSNSIAAISNEQRRQVQQHGLMPFMRPSLRHALVGDYGSQVACTIARLRQLGDVGVSDWP